MAISPKRPCNHPGCRELITTGSYCQQHQHLAPDARKNYDATTRKNTPELAQAKKIRDSARWQIVRRLHKSLNPCCCDPFDIHRIGALTTESHHIMGLASRPELAYDMRNLAPLCSACHARIEGMQRRGDDALSIFRGRAINTPMGLELLYCENVT